MNEMQRRVVAGAMAEMLGRGGKTAVAAASGMSRNTVIKAEGEVKAGIVPSNRQRAVGGGDIKAEPKQPGLLQALDELVDPETRGNAMSKLRWTSKSSTKLADELVGQGFEVSARSVRDCCTGWGIRSRPTQGQRGPPASRPRRPVPPHQLPARRPRCWRSAGDQRGHQEEVATRSRT